VQDLAGARRRLTAASRNFVGVTYKETSLLARLDKHKLGK
jgi:hypothetical protein